MADIATDRRRRRRPEISAFQWLTLAVVAAGHIRMAARDPEARLGMRTGLVDRDWAAREHPYWRRERRALTEK